LSIRFDKCDRQLLKNNNNIHTYIWPYAQHSQLPILPESLNASSQLGSSRFKHRTLVLNICKSDDQPPACHIHHSHAQAKQLIP